MPHDERGNSGDPRAPGGTSPDDLVDQASRDSFPASDPPAFVAGASRKPARGGERGDRPGPRRRNRAGIVVIVASVWALVSTIRMPPDLMTEEGSPLVGRVPFLMLVYGAGALLGLGGLAVAQKQQWSRPARFVVGAGGLALLAGLVTLRDFTLVSILSLGLPALALLLAAPFVGEVPRWEDA